MARSVLIVGPHDAALEDLVRASGAVPAWAADLTNVAVAGTVLPGVALVDLRGHHQIPPGLAAMKRHHPATAIIIVASTLDPALILGAMRAGVNECIAEPLSRADLDAALRRVAGALDTSPAGLVFAFVGAKGGVGTTTAAVNVASALVKLSRASVLLVDLHAVHGDAAVYLGAEARYSTADALENMDRLDPSFFRSLVHRTASGVELLASSDRLASSPLDARRVAALVEFASHQARYTVLDVPRTESAALDGLDHASAVMVVANQELATVRNACRVAAALRTRYGKAKVKVVLNRTDRRSEIGYEDVERAIGSPVAHQLPSDYRGALAAMNRGRPIALDAQNGLADAFTTLARELAGIKPDRQPERATGFIGKLAGLRSA